MAKLNPKKDTEEQAPKSRGARKRKTKDEKKPKKSEGVFREYGKAIGSALLIAMVLKLFIFQPFRIPTGSMLETLQIGDFLFVEKWTYGAITPERVRIPFINWTIVEGLPTVKLPGFREPRQGDIIVFAYPKDRNLDYIKRCVAVEGDTIKVRDGVLFVNSEIYESNFGDRDGDHSCVPAWTDPENCPAPRTKHDQAAYVSRPNLRTWPSPGQGEFYVVPEDHIFMMGDNRYNSADSRYWGPLDVSLIKGRAAIIYFSWDQNRNLPRFNRIGDIIR